MSGSGTGDPYIHPIAGAIFEFSGAHGRHYVAAADANLAILFRVADVGPGAPGRQYIDQVLVRAADAGPAVSVGLADASFGDAALELDGAPADGPGLTARYHTGAAGERRVDITSGDWKVAIIQDDGSDPARHGDGPLDGVAHLGFFVDAHPSDGLRGLLVDGAAGCDPEAYLATP